MTALAEMASPQYSFEDDFDAALDRFAKMHSTWIFHKGKASQDFMIAFREAETYYRANRDKDPLFRIGALAAMASKGAHVAAGEGDTIYQEIFEFRERVYLSLYGVMTRFFVQSEKEEPIILSDII